MGSDGAHVCLQIYDAQLTRVTRTIEPAVMRFSAVLVLDAAQLTLPPHALMARQALCGLLADSEQWQQYLNVIAWEACYCTARAANFVMNMHDRQSVISLEFDVGEKSTSYYAKRPGRKELRYE